MGIDPWRKKQSQCFRMEALVERASDTSIETRKFALGTATKMELTISNRLLWSFACCVGVSTGRRDKCFSSKVSEMSERQIRHFVLILWESSI